MARVSLIPLKQKNKGLWISGPREKTGIDYLRRNRGINLLRETELRSRNGTTADASISAAHSLTKFNDVRYQGATTILYKAGSSIDTGYDGTSLEFAASEPRTGTDAEYLFVSGGGKLRKVDTSGTVTQWGISPPSSGNWGTSVGGNEESEDSITVFDPQEKTIAVTNSTANWTIGFQRKPGSLRVVTGQINPSGVLLCADTLGIETEDFV